jgi:hypothetical protein
VNKNAVGRDSHILGGENGRTSVHRIFIARRDYDSMDERTCFGLECGNSIAFPRPLVCPYEAICRNSGRGKPSSLTATMWPCVGFKRERGYLRTRPEGDFIDRFALLPALQSEDRA